MEEIRRFSGLCSAFNGQERARVGIGTLSEKTLHAVLKQFFEPDTAKHEVKVGRYIADIVNDSGIIEIQTRAFHALRPKLTAFLERGPVTVVYPIAHTKWLYWIDPESGALTNKRKSPKTGSVYDAFYELYKIKPLLPHPNLTLCFPLIDVEEYRYLNEWSIDRKKGSSRCERIPVALSDMVYLRSIADYRALVPNPLPDAFTTRDFAHAAKLRQNAAQRVVHILHYMGVLVRTGKQGAFYEYQIK